MQAEPGAPRSIETFLRRVVLITLAYAVGVHPAIEPILDPDVFFNLRLGEWVLEHGVPDTDPFSTSGDGKPFVAYFWGPSVACHLLHRACGWPGLVALTAAFGLAFALALHRLMRGERVSFLQGASALVVGLVACMPLLSPRTWLISMLAYALVVDVLARRRDGGSARPLALLPLVFFLWANAHIQFVYGLAALAIFAVEPLLEQALARARGEPAPARALDRPLVAATAACALATLATPYHVRLWGVIADYATHSSVARLVGEHMGPTFRDVSSWAGLALLLAAALTLGWRRERRPAPYLLLLMGVFFAFKAMRDVWVLVVPACAILGGTFRESTAPAELDPFTPTRPQALTSAVAVLLALAGLWLARGISSRSLEAAIAGAFPADAADVVVRERLPGPLLNSYDWGGYLTWRLRHVKVSIDGRTNLHGDERILRSSALWDARPGWRDDPDLRAANLVIGDAGAPLTALLRDDPAFRVVHEDARAVVLVRR